LNSNRNISKPIHNVGKLPTHSSNKFGFIAQDHKWYQPQYRLNGYVFGDKLDMNDPQIRNAFHSTYLLMDHIEPNTLILDELGLEHGECRADIAVINGHLNGFEIKSDKDTLYRLENQINIYNAVFDHSSIIVSDSHILAAMRMIPEWWGVILAIEDFHSSCIQFKLIRSPQQNIYVDDYAVVQLLWRNEAQEALLNLGMRGKQLREKRSNLYHYLVERLNSQDLRFLVREYLKKRQSWRCPVRPFLYGD
jgi:hypothetical protein